MTSLTRSSEVKAILAMAGTSIRCADHSTIWALRHRTTEPDPRRTIWRSLLACSLVMSLTATRSAMAPLCATGRSKWWTRPSTLPVTALDGTVRRQARDVLPGVAGLEQDLLGVLSQLWH